MNLRCNKPIHKYELQILWKITSFYVDKFTFRELGNIGYVIEYL